MAHNLIEIVERNKNECNQRATFTSLSDDCLLQIFSNLSAIDLSVIKKCSRRFAGLADYVARRRYRHGAFEYCTSADHGTSHSGCVAALHNFGAHMHQIRIEMDCFCKNYDRAHYASAGFGRYNCSGAQMLTALKHCINLRSLTLVRMQLHNVSTREVSKALQSLEHLDTLRLIECAGIESNITRLIKSCKSLKNLSLHSEEVYSWTAAVSDSISKCISNVMTIQQISLRLNDLQSTFIENVMELRNLDELRKLELDCGGSSEFNLAPAIHALATTDSLEELVLEDLLPNDAIGRALDRFTHLKSCVMMSDSEIDDDVMATMENFGRSLHWKQHTCEISKKTVEWNTLTLLRKDEE